MIGIPVVKPKFALGLRGSEALAGYLFLLPWLIGIVCFVAGPMLASAWLSFTKYDIVNPPKFIGLKNYTEIFTKDHLFWPSIQLTFKYAAIVVPVSLIGSLLAAILLNQVRFIVHTSSGNGYRSLERRWPELECLPVAGGRHISHADEKNLHCPKKSRKQDTYMLHEPAENGRKWKKSEDDGDWKSTRRGDSD